MNSGPPSSRRSEVDSSRNRNLWPHRPSDLHKLAGERFGSLRHICATHPLANAHVAFIKETAVQKQFKSYPVYVQRPPIPDEDPPKVTWSDVEYERKLADAYLSDVNDELEFIDKPGVGRLLLQALPSNEVVLIAKRKQSAALTVAEDNQHGYVAGYVFNPGTIYEKKAVGGGSNTVIFFKPGGEVGSCVNADADDPCIGLTDEEVLVHELVHAMRDMEGKFNPIALREPDKDYDDVEEFYAILVANIFMSERGEKQLRKDHHDVKHPLKAAWSTSAGFLSDATNRKWVSRFCLFEEPTLARQIAALTTSPFNPIREFLNNTGKYP
jgi:Effector protein